MKEVLSHREQCGDRKRAADEDTFFTKGSSMMEIRRLFGGGRQTALLLRVIHGTDEVAANEALTRHDTDSRRTRE